MLRRLSYITLIFVLLITTVGFTIDFHYCNDKIYDFGIYTEATSCCAVDEYEHSDKKMHHHSCEPESHERDCKDETLKFKSFNNFINPSNNFDISNVSTIDLFIMSKLVTDMLILSDNITEEIPHYSIPPPKKSILLALHQSYLL
jgi:hypothetical protein